MKSWIAAAAVYKDKRMLTIFFLGLSSGLPSPLLFFNLTVWLKDEGFSYASIGLFSLIGTAYAVNFLWAPLIDKLTLGALTRSLGRRRAWALLSQIALMGSILCMGFLGPNAGLTFFALSAIMVAFFSATQDIIVDAYRIDVLAPHEYAAGSAMAVFGWHMGGTIVGGAGGLYLVALFDWRTAYMVLAGFVLVGIITILVCREPDPSSAGKYAAPGDAGPDRVIGRSGLRQNAGIFFAWLYHAASAPLTDFFRRLGGTIMLILAFILIYKIGEAMLGRMSGVFYRDLGFGYADIANVAKL
ncbi:MAG: MFS transporter, partial [Rhodospirillales bacterium]|nr:MFS transporter [Rhodospirillales bacterium]